MEKNTWTSVPSGSGLLTSTMMPPEEMLRATALHSPNDSLRIETGKALPMRWLLRFSIIAGPLGFGMKRKSKNSPYPTWAYVVCPILFLLLLPGRPFPVAHADSTADFVDVLALEPTLRVELRYATDDNFMH